MVVKELIKLLTRMKENREIDDFTEILWRDEEDCLHTLLPGELCVGDDILFFRDGRSPIMAGDPADHRAQTWIGKALLIP